MMAAPEPGSSYRPRLQRRLLLAFCGFSLLVVTLQGALSMMFVYVIEDELFAAALRAEAQRQETHHRTYGSFAPPALPFVRLYTRGEALPADLAEQVARGPARGEFSGAEGRHYHLHRMEVGDAVLVAEVSSQLVVRPLRNELLRWLLGSAAAATALALILGWWISRYIGAPLATLARRVADSAPDALPGNLGHGLAHDEVGELARHLDALHARTRDLIAREQAFTADASHELRTPLSVLAIACERLDAQTSGGHKSLVQSMRAAVWQLQQTVELMLALAREAPVTTHSSPPQLLLPVLERLVLAYAPLLDQHGVSVELDVPAGVTRDWPGALAQLLVGNLLANAIAHACTPQIRIEADALELRVRNASQAPPAQVLGDGAAGLVRGAKGATSQGHGLGLSIVRRLAERHALSLELHHRDGITTAALRACERAG